MPRPCCAAALLALALACTMGPRAARSPPPPAASAEPCEPEDCGPAPATTPWLCAEGGVSGKTGQCLRDAGGTCRWEVRTCAEPVSCGVAGASCPDGFQCLDDPRDDCDPSERGSFCGGLCVKR